MLQNDDSMPGSNRTFQPEVFAEKWKVSEEVALKIFERNSELLERKRLAFFNSRYMALSDVRKLKKDFFHGRCDISIFGVGFVNPELMKTPEFRKLPPLSPDGEFLGFDLYGFYFFGKEAEYPCGRIAALEREREMSFLSLLHPLIFPCGKKDKDNPSVNGGRRRCEGCPLHSGNLPGSFFPEWS